MGGRAQRRMRIGAVNQGHVFDVFVVTNSLPCQFNKDSGEKGASEVSRSAVLITAAKV